MSNLNFDNAFDVDLKQAKEYLRKISSDIHPLGLEEYEDGNYDHDSCHNKLHFVDYKKSSFKFMQEPSQVSVLATVDMYNKLACKVKANAELFAQIEYMTRKVSAHETVSYHINLIVQNLFHWSTQVGKFSHFKHCGQIIMNDKAPLSSLGCLAQLLCMHTSCVIESTKETALVCHLFTQLCHEVGMRNVYLLLVEDPTNIKELRNSHIELNTIESLGRGAAGVVTGHADVDSAVDAFLTASNMFPWHLRRLLVQENVYESFKKAVSWKANLKNTSNNCQLIQDRYESKCTDLFIYDEKVFLLNYVGSFDELGEMSKHAVVVEAFRTTKELLSLVKQYKPHALSVWSCDIAEANEIAFGLNIPIIWINDINNFNGPPKSSQGFYSNIVQHHATIKLDKTADLEILVNLRNAWLNLNFNKRREKILRAIENCDFGENKVALEFARQLQCSVCEDSNKFIEIESSRMCIGIKETTGIVFAMVQSIDNLFDVIKSSVFGNGVVVSFKWLDELRNVQILTEALKKEGVPILITEDAMPSGDFLEIKSPYLMFKTRVIWTNFGTIFAN